MFWRFGFHTQSAIDTLLDKEEVTLEEVLEEEELIQECKSHNRKLVDFICRPEVLDALLTYIIEKPAEDLDEGVKYKYPCLSAEIFGCEVLAICDALIRNDNLLREFWKFLDQPAPLNPIQASYFSRVFAVLLQKKTGETVQFFKDQEGCLDKLLNHIGTSAVMDLTLKLLTAEETKEGGGVLQWLLDNGLVLKLTDKLDPNLSKETHTNASQLLIDIMAVAQNFGTRNPVLEQLKSGPVATKLLDHLVKADSPNIHSAIAGGFGVFIELIQRSLGFVHDGEPADIDFKEEDLTELMAALEPKLGKFHEIMLDAKPAGVSQAISESTPERPLPLGSVRLKIIELFVIILHSNSSLINKKILELNVIPSYIDLFFKYQWNNFLHSLVHDMIVKIFSFDLQHVDDLMINVLKDGRLTEKIVEAAKQNEADVEERKGVRRGYMGHLILISNHLVKYAELPDVSNEIKSYFQSENWKDFEKLILAETNQRDSKPLGGHRPVLTNPDNDDVLHPALNDGDTSADQFGEEEDDDFDMDDEVIEKPNFEAAGAYSNDHYLRSAIEFDDSDDEPESPQNDNWANFNSAFESKSKFDEDDHESQRNSEGLN